MLYGVSQALPFLADALSYVISFATLSLIRADLRVRRTTPGTGTVRAEVAAGVRWLWVLLLPPIAAAPDVLVLAPLVAAMAFVGPVWSVVVVGYQYKVIPDEMLGRVKSVVLLVSWGAIPFGSLLAGGLLDTVTPAGAVVALCGLTLLVALVATTSPGIRRSTVLAGH